MSVSNIGEQGSSCALSKSHGEGVVLCSKPFSGHNRAGVFFNYHCFPGVQGSGEVHAAPPFVEVCIFLMHCCLPLSQRAVLHSPQPPAALLSFSSVPAHSHPRAFAPAGPSAHSTPPRRSTFRSLRRATLLLQVSTQMPPSL